MNDYGNEVNISRSFQRRILYFKRDIAGNSSAHMHSPLKSRLQATKQNETQMQKLRKKQQAEQN